MNTLGKGHFASMLVEFELHVYAAGKNVSSLEARLAAELKQGSKDACIAHLGEILADILRSEE